MIKKKAIFIFGITVLFLGSLGLIAYELLQAPKEILPASLPINKTVIGPGFSEDKRIRIQKSIDRIYAILPDDYQYLKNPGIVLNTQSIDAIREAGFGVAKSQIEAYRGRSISGETGGEVNYVTMINGDEVDDQSILSHLSYGQGTQFERTLVHELAHVLAAEKFGDPNGNKEWQEIHVLSVSENKGFVVPDIARSDDGAMPYAAVNAAEDLAMTVEIYAMTNGSYKDGDPRSDEILSQKVVFLRANGFLK